VFPWNYLFIFLATGIWDVEVAVPLQAANRRDVKVTEVAVQEAVTG
jgi:hypothetical protein